MPLLLVSAVKGMNFAPLVLNVFGFKPLSSTIDFPSGVSSPGTHAHASTNFFH
jgi:hypothetical protein